MTAKISVPWSQEDMDIVAQMYVDGAPQAEICQRVGRSSHSIKSMVTKLQRTGVVPVMKGERIIVAKQRKSDESIREGNRKLRDAMIAYYRRYSWKDAA